MNRVIREGGSIALSSATTEKERDGTFRAQRRELRKMTVPQFLDYCVKRQWTVSITPRGDAMKVQVYDTGGALIGRGDSLAGARENGLAMALIAASKSPSELED